MSYLRNYLFFFSVLSYFLSSHNHTRSVAVVPDPPFLSQFPESIIVNAGQTATLRCIATGTPPPSFQWFKDGNDVSGNTGVTITTSNGDSTLNITNVQPSDAGTYECRAFNSEGSDSGSATVTVIGE